MALETVVQRKEYITPTTRRAVSEALQIPLEQWEMATARGVQSYNPPVFVDKHGVEPSCFCAWANGYCYSITANFFPGEGGAEAATLYEFLIEKDGLPEVSRRQLELGDRLNDRKRKKSTQDSIPTERVSSLGDLFRFLDYARLNEYRQSN